jgi:hypothetical protein
MAGLVNAQTTLEAITDPDAYAIYELVIPPKMEGTPPIQIQRETVTDVIGCVGFLDRVQADWQPLVQAFRRENLVVRTLRPLLNLPVAYQLIAAAQIEADDARLAVKYPGTWQRRPESMDFVAVSSIGFDEPKARALMYARNRMRGGFVFLEKQDGRWQLRRSGVTCGWVV